LIITSEIFAAEYAIGIEIKKDETAKWKIVIIIFHYFIVITIIGKCKTSGII